MTDKGKRIAGDLIKSHETIADFLEIIGVRREQAEVDACELEHHISENTLEKLKRFIEFTNNGPNEPRWIEHYRHYIDTGERKKCEFYDGKNSPR
ncbi:MAG: metal-dependent transcriptional regulator [Candidatus Natronoplasma sp.]